MVLLHASPSGSATLTALGERLAQSFTVYAIDTPGHGDSDPLAEPEPEIADFGRALGETLDGLGLDRVHLYGTHTGAKVALSYAVTRPAGVASLLLDGVGVATDAERADLREHYTPTFALRGDGTHLLAAWQQVRNMYLFWPWYRELEEARYATPMPSPRDLHELTVGMLVAGEHYPLAYQAAFACDPLPLLRRVGVPTVVVASEHDPLFAQLERIPSLGGDVRVVRHRPGGSDDAALARVLAEHVTAHSAAVPDAPAAAPPTLDGADRTPVGVARGFAVAGDAELHLRSAGRGGRPLVLLPPAPASGAALDWLLVPAGASRLALAIDLPGTADSQLGTATDRTSMVEAVLAGLDGLGLDEFDLYGAGAGAGIAAGIATRAPERVHAAVIAGEPAATDLPDLAPDPLGLHLVRAWHLLRDHALRRTPAATGRSGPSVDLAVCQARVLDLVKACDTYAVALRATRSPARAAGGRVPLLAGAPHPDPLAFVDPAQDAPPAGIAADAPAILAALDAVDG
ncbi:alpha/beta fold hydrolase [Dactylosporangium sucinum]|uniref:alpha/beta fold hydrolase n=1 Tax=Dactylosporangium sucinum TaxID=1424081 RepID=UPI00167D03E1|nr:alpha/beta fold hydrolase [Dactylosporangium sucinum]